MTASFPGGLERALPAGALVAAGGQAAYAVDGLSPMAVALPYDRRQVGEVMRWAAENRVTVFPRGGGVMLGLGNPPARVGLVLDLSRLNRVIDYQPGDMTVSVEAGVTLAELQRELAGARQFAPLESPLAKRATVGGILATACVGAMAHAYGPPRDWLIGIGVVGADGVATKAGGRVVKNVTGYDLNKLYTGSLGTLAVVVEATFKVSPRPPEECMLAAYFGSMSDAVAAGRAALNLAAGPLSYLAVTGGLARQLLDAAGQDGPGDRMDGLGLGFFAGRAGAVRRRVEETSAFLLGDAGAGGAVRVDGAAAAAARQWVADVGWQDGFAPALSLKLSAPRRVIPALADAVRRVGLMGELPEVMADPGFGAARVFFWGDFDDDAGILATVAEIRRVAREYGGTAVVEGCHPSVKAQMEVWGDAPEAMALMRRVKEQLDPHHLLNPGRFVGRL